MQLYISATDFITDIQSFNTLPDNVIKELIQELQPVRYQLGETIILKERIPIHVVIICRGQVRLWSCDPRSNKEVTSGQGIQLVTCLEHQ